MQTINNFLGLFTSPTPILQFQLNQSPDNKFFKTKNQKGEKIKLPIFRPNQKIGGIVIITLPNQKKFQHKGIKCQIFGQIQILNEVDLSMTFFHQQKVLERAGTINEYTKIQFSIDKFNPNVESYDGISAKITYFMRVKLVKDSQVSFQVQKKFAVLLNEYKLNKPIENLPVKMQIGIPSKLKIQFQFNKTIYNLKDCILGNLYFEKNDMDIRSVNLYLIKSETTGLGLTAITQKKSVYHFQIMDGCTMDKVQIPIRVYLSPVPLTPTYSSIFHRLHVKVMRK